jgi:hypothetical protein
VSALTYLEGTADPAALRNGNELPREDVITHARQHIRALASEGLSAGQIESMVNRGSLNASERELVWLIASHEVDRVRHRAG